MTFDELKSRIDKAVTNPDSIQADIGAIMEDIKSDYETLNGLVEKVTAQDEKIRTLQDTNTRLYLQIAGEPDGDEVPEPEPEGDEAIEKFFNDFIEKEKEG